nr:GNAT family N-acetyltransferase [Gemmatimonadales bacterium]
WAQFRPGWTVQDFGDSIAARANTDSVPLTLVALEGQELIGTICLDTHDMAILQDLTPWLAGLYVREDRRNQGLGTRLVHAAEAKAAELGIHRLYLYTPDAERFYARLGWSLREKVVYHGCKVAIMEKGLPGRRQV